MTNQPNQIRSLHARTMEIVKAHPDGIHSSIAFRQAVDELCGGSYDRAIDILSGEWSGKLRDAKKSVYVLPEDPTLFDIPEWIVIATPLGDYWVEKERATAGQVEQFFREGEQWHGGQHKRFKAKHKQVKELGLDQSRPYMEQIRELRGADKGESDDQA